MYALVFNKMALYIYYFISTAQFLFTCKYNVQRFISTIMVEINIKKMLAMNEKIHQLLRKNEENLSIYLSFVSLKNIRGNSAKKY